MGMINKNKYKGVHTFILSKDGKEISRKVFENIIVKEGRNKVNEILAGATLTTNGINYCGLGTGSTAISDDDTQLESESARKIRGSYSLDTTTDSFIVSFYFNPREANGTFTRYATFIDGTETANSGGLFSHAEITLTKASGEGLTIVSEYTLYDYT